MKPYKFGADRSASSLYGDDESGDSAFLGVFGSVLNSSPEAGSGSPDLSAAADLGGFSMLCGCAACLAARKGETSTFKAEAVQVAADKTPSLPVADAAAAAGAFTAGAATEPTYALNALLAGSSNKWGNSPAGTAVVVTYSFLTSVPGYYPPGAGERTHFVAMNAVQQQAAKDALALYSEAANITFVLVAAGTGSINFGTADLGNGIGGWAYYPRPYSGATTTRRPVTSGSPIATSYNNPTSEAGSIRPTFTRSVMRSG